MAKSMTPEGAHRAVRRRTPDPPLWTREDPTADAKAAWTAALLLLSCVLW